MRSQALRLAPFLLVFLALIAGLLLFTRPEPKPAAPLRDVELDDALDSGDPSPSDPLRVDAPSGFTARELDAPADPREPVRRSARGFAPIAILGRIVDENGRGRSAWDVGWHDERRRVARTRTTADGRFALQLPDGHPDGPLEGCLLWRSAEEAGATLLTLTPWDRGSFDLGLLVAEPAARLDVTVERDGEPAARAAVRVYAEDVALVAEALCDDDGRASFFPLPRGRWLVAAGRAGERGEATAVVRSAEEPHAVRIALQETRQVDARFPSALERLPDLEAFELRAPTSRLRVSPLTWGRPYAFARAERLPGENAVRWHDVGRNDRPRLFLWDREHALDEPTGSALRTSAEDLAFGLRACVPWRWSCRDDPARPADGEIVVLVPLQRAPSPLAFEGSVRDGHVEFLGPELPPEWSGLALTRSGTHAALDASRSAIAFHPLPIVEVLVVDGQEQPRPGVLVRIAVQGEGTPCATGRTDARGLAVLPVVPRGPLSITLLPEDAPGALPVRVGELAAATDRHRLRAVLPNAARVLLSLRDDRELLVPPPELALRAQGAVIEGLAIDAERRSVAFTVRPLMPRLGTLAVRIEVPGFLPAEAEVEPRAAALQEIEVALSRGGSVHLHVLEPADGAYRLRLQRAPEGRDVWFSVPARFEPDASEGLVARSLAPGRYRIQDELSRRTTETFDLTGSASRAELALDLSSAGWVEGRIEAPPDATIQRASVLVTDLAGNYRMRTGVGRDGRFRVRVDGRTAVRLTAEHPERTAAVPGGAVEVLTPRGEVLLKLGDG